MRCLGLWCGIVVYDFSRWEYPFFAAWDTAFHCIPLAVVDPSFAKKQLDLLTREWYMKPDGQIPAYEWNFSDVNPPVHAWYVTVCNVFLCQPDWNPTKGDFPSIQDWAKVTRTRRCPLPWTRFPKIASEFHMVYCYSHIHFRSHARNSGGLTERIRVEITCLKAGSWDLTILVCSIDRRHFPLAEHYVKPMGPLGWHSTAWTCKYFESSHHAWSHFCRLNMALELAKRNTVYEDIASKFFEVCSHSSWDSNP